MQYVNWSALAVIVSVAVVAAALIGGLRWSVAGASSALRVAATVLLLGASSAVVTLSLFGRSPGVAGTNFVPLRSIIGELGNINQELGVLNVAGNVLMYAPIGFLAPLAFGLRWFQGISFGAALSVVMELVQYLSDSGAADVDDVILNGCGALLGAVLAAVVRRLVPAARGERTVAI